MSHKDHTTAMIVRELRTVTGVVQVGQRPKDGYVDVTALCQAAGKFYANWYDRKRTKRFLESLSTTIGIPIVELIQVVMGGKDGSSRTLAHPKVATSIAMWCSPEFEAQVSSWFVDFVEGYLPPPPPQTALQAFQAAVAHSALVMADHEGRLDSHDMRLDGHDNQLIELRTLVGARLRDRLKRWQRISLEESYEEMVKLLYEFAGGTCLCCGLLMTFVEGQPLTIEIDEVHPCGRGGWRDWDNVQPLCNKCNNRKKMHTWDFREKRPSFRAMRDRYLAHKEARRREIYRQPYLFNAGDNCSTPW